MRSRWDWQWRKASRRRHGQRWQHWSCSWQHQSGGGEQRRGPGWRCHRGQAGKIDLKEERGWKRDRKREWERNKEIGRETEKESGRMVKERGAVRYYWDTNIDGEWMFPCWHIWALIHNIAIPPIQIRYMTANRCLYCGQICKVKKWWNKQK